MNAPISMTMDTRGLQAAILEVVPKTRRTVAEQCVTSMGMILQDTQTYGDNAIPFVDIGRMDAELDAPADIPFSHTNSLGIKTEGTHQPGITEGEMIVIARMHPNSRYSQLTGNRWPVAMPDFSGRRDGGSAFWGFVKTVKERMRMGRHSSGHFLQSGFKWAIEQCVTSDLFKNPYRKRDALSSANQLNTLDYKELGRLDMTSPDAPNFRITAENNVGQDGNEVLDAKHRQALIDYASGPLQDAIEKERGVQVGELARRLEVEFEKTNKMLA